MAGFTRISIIEYGCLLLFAALVILFSECATHKNKITYNIPATLSKENREKLITILDRGKELYKANCSECHGIFTQGKDSIPNFTNQQIDNYSSRFMRKDPKNHAVVIKMTGDQLNSVLTFLKYKNPENADSIVRRRRP